MKKITLYSGSIGINNKITSHRLFFKENGIVAFEQAKNVLIDQTGEVVTRKGTLQVESGDYHSLFSGDDWGIVAKNRINDTALYQVIVDQNNTITLTGIRDNLTKEARIDFCDVQNVIFYSNGYENGMITKDCISVPWKESINSNNRSLKNFVAPPVGDHLCYNAGRIYWSRTDKGKYVLEYTEFGRLGLYNAAINGEQFSSRIQLIVSAVDGLYVSDEKAIYFLVGLNPHEWVRKKVCDYPALEWGKFPKTIDPSKMGIDSNIPSALIATVNGPMICLPSGQVINLIDKNVTMPVCLKEGAISMMDESLIIQTWEN